MNLLTIKKIPLLREGLGEAMMGLLAIEWLKIKRYRTFWILVGFFLALLFLWNYEAMKGNINIGGGKKNHGMSIISTDYSFPQAWSNIGFWASMFIVFISILVIILTTNEYTYRTNRQNVIDGWTRLQFYHAKVLVVVILSLLSSLYVVLLGAILSALQSGSFHGFFNEFYHLGYFFLLSLDYLGFALFIAILIKRSGLAIGLFLLYAMMIETILKAVINNYADKPYGNLLPLQASDELLPFPFPQMLKPMVASIPSLSMPTYVWVAVGWCTLYYIAGRILLLRNDW